MARTGKILFFSSSAVAGIKENNNVKRLTGSAAAVFCLYLCESMSQLRFTSQKRKAFRQAHANKDRGDTQRTQAPQAKDKYMIAKTDKEDKKQLLTRRGPNILKL